VAGTLESNVRTSSAGVFANRIGEVLFSYIDGGGRAARDRGSKTIVIAGSTGNYCFYAFGDQ
jgi:hypothetical protein